MSLNLSPDINGLPTSLRAVDSLVFDVIGTCTDWLTPVRTCLIAHAFRTPSLKDLPQSEWDQFAHEWRAAFFALTKKAGMNETEYIPVAEVYRETLSDLLLHRNIEWDVDIQNDLCNSWSMSGVWKDTVGGLEALRSKFTVFALSNGSTRSVIANNKRNGVSFDFLLTSDVVGFYKPNPRMYATALKALGHLDSPGSVAMVASHVYDLVAAGACGYRTIYIQRATEDMGVNLEDFNFDLVINEGGLGELARRLGADVV